MEYKALKNGLKMPMVGLGVYNISERETQRVVKDAISVGYRSIDTAAMYYNEELKIEYYDSVYDRERENVGG